MKSIVLLLFAIFISTSVRAQIIEDVGIKVSATISNFRITDINPIIIGGRQYYINYVQDNVVNPSISCFADVLKSEHLNLQVVLSYLRKGASRTSELLVTTPESPDGTSQKVSMTTDIGLHYLELVLAVQPTQPIGEIQVYAQIGPTFNYLLSSSNLTPFTEDLSTFQVGYCVGVGVDPSRIFKKNVFFEIRYSADFRYFYQSSAKFWNRSWMFSVGTTL